MKSQFQRRGGALAIGLMLLLCASNAGLRAAEGNGQLSPADLQDIARIEAYLNGIDTLQARFLQTSSDGRIAEGIVYLDRPGRLRMDYAPPVPLEVVATGSLLVYHDKELRQVRQVPIGATPASALLVENPKLSGDITVTDVERVGRAVKVTMVQTSDAEAGSLTLGFSDDPLMLRRVVLTDAEGMEVRIALMEHQFGVPLDEGLFRFVDPYAAGSRD